METVRLIIECGLGGERERWLGTFGKILYRLPMINSYVVEVSGESAEALANAEGVTSVCQTAVITAQTNWARGFTGKNICVAILDTGVGDTRDLGKRVVVFKDFVQGKPYLYDDNGHGTHVAGIVAGNGLNSDGMYCGVAPEANVAAIKILNEKGHGDTADVLAGIQWVLDNRARFSIRIMNLSIGMGVAKKKDPLISAVEAVWDAGIVVVTAAGNSGPAAGSVTSPGVSRKVLTVGSSDDGKTVYGWGSTLKNFSGRGPTSECIVKPDIVAPGADIISCLAPNLPKARLRELDGQIVSADYVRMSGTSMSTPMVSGAAALLLQKYPDLTPDDVKFMLRSAAVDLNLSENQQGLGLLDIKKLMEEEEIHVREHV